MIKKLGNGKFAIISEKTGRRLGLYPTREEAEKRLQQIEMFKAMKGRK